MISRCTAIDYITLAHSDVKSKRVHVHARGPRDGKETFRGTERQGGGLPQHGLRRWGKKNNQVALLLQQKTTTVQR